jgi:hypothetical protein
MEAVFSARSVSSLYKEFIRVRSLDWKLDLLQTYRTCDYTLQIIVTHRPVSLVTLLGNGL